MAILEQTWSAASRPASKLEGDGSAALAPGIVKNREMQRTESGFKLIMGGNLEFITLADNPISARLPVSGRAMELES
jgi:hypothetical protein